MATPSPTRNSPTTFTVDQEVIDELKTNFRVLPLYEKTLYEHTLKKCYSMNNNEYLSCRWTDQKNKVHSRVFVPHQMINPRDFHFYNCDARFMPSQNVYTKTDFRMKMGYGPGVDSVGQKPIPQEMLMKRSGGRKPLNVSINNPKRSSEEKENKNQESNRALSSEHNENKVEYVKE